MKAQNRVQDVTLAGVVAVVVCGSGPACTEDKPAPDYEVRCVDVATWPVSQMSHVVPTASGLLLAGQQAEAQGVPLTTWVGSVDASGALVWEIELPEAGPISSVIVGDDGRISVLQRAGAGSVLHEVSATGQLLNTTALSTSGGENVLATAMVLGEGGTLVLGGVHDGDFWIGRLATNGEVEFAVAEDYREFTEVVTSLNSTDDGIVATIRAGTTPGVIGGDVVVQETADTLVMFYDSNFKETHREIFSHDEDLVSTIPNTTALLTDGSVIVGGYRASSQSTEDTSAWAARVTRAGTAWLLDWEGPEDRSTNYQLATIEAISEVEPGVAVLAGRQDVASGIRRWHVIVEAETGTVGADEVGGPESVFDSYLAGSETGANWLAGASVFSKGQGAQWVCEITSK